jgi:hypothetical protein
MVFWGMSWGGFVGRSWRVFCFPVCIAICFIVFSCVIH